MTVPYERYNAVLNARRFLLAIGTDKQRYPRIPKAVRQEALGILKHFPAEHDMMTAAKESEVFKDRF
jgi:hypothetical protein